MLSQSQILALQGTPATRGRSSVKLKLRPNFILYVFEKTLLDADLPFLEKVESCFCEFKAATYLGALIGFLDLLPAGAYISDEAFKANFTKTAANLVVSLVDPHAIDDFELRFKARRLGVLVRRRIIAMDDFQTTFSLDGAGANPA